MKNSRTTTMWQTRRGFTLIEILTVCVIILILAGLLLPAIQGSIKKAEKAKAKDSVSQLGAAMQAYMMEFGRLPTNANSSSFMITTSLWNNVNGIVFYTASPKDIAASNSTYNAINGNGCILDPWGSPYYCLQDDSYTGTFLTDPCSGTALGKGYAIWSAGPDGQSSVTTGSGTLPCTVSGGVNADNVTSW